MHGTSLERLSVRTLSSQIDRQISGRTFNHCDYCHLVIEAVPLVAPLVALLVALLVASLIALLFR